jgi:hypothetical protein
LECGALVPPLTVAPRASPIARARRLAYLLSFQCSQNARKILLTGICMYGNMFYEVAVAFSRPAFAALPTNQQFPKSFRSHSYEARPESLQFAANNSFKIKSQFVKSFVFHSYEKHARKSFRFHSYEIACF